MDLPAPRLTVVILTWNEAEHIGECLDALAAQTEQAFEVVVVDAASTDATADAVRDRLGDFVVPLRLDVAAERISVGAARNRGVRLAAAPAVAFLSADTVPQPDWVEWTLHGLGHADLVFGRQVHAPRAPSVAAAVRGLRYHFPDGPVADPARYASHVNAGIRRTVLERFPIDTDPAGSAVDDILLVRRAAAAGFVAAYEPRMVVRHRDVDSVGAEWRKNAREGLGWGVYARELGPHRLALAWAALLGGTAAWLALAPGSLPVAALGLTVWAPALRRAALRRDMPVGMRIMGAASAPIFDFAFLIHYLRSLARRRTRTGTEPLPMERDT